MVRVGIRVSVLFDVASEIKNLLLQSCPAITLSPGGIF